MSRDSFQSSDGTFSGLMGKVKAMRGKRNGFIFAFVLVILLAFVLLFLLPASFITFLLLAAVAFAIPYYMGIKRFRQIVITGLVLMLVFAFIFDASYTNYLYTVPLSVIQDQSLNNTPGYFFGHGGVSPRSGSSSTSFSFTIQFYHPSDSALNYSVYLDLHPVLVSSKPLNQSLTAVSNRTLPSGEVLTSYVYNHSIGADNVYIMQYEANVSGKWIFSSVSVGLSTSTETNTYTLLIYPSIILMLLSVATLYFGIALIVLLFRQSRQRRERAASYAFTSSREESDRRRTSSTGQKPARQGSKVKEEKYVCSSCGASVPADATVCPSCGEKFD